MFNQRNIQRFGLLLQPTLVGYISSLFANFISNEEASENVLYQIVRSRSSLTPPGYVFPIVWGILFLLIGYSAFRVFNINKKIRDSALLWNQIQLFFNFLWTIFYFGLRIPFLAFIDILLLLLSIFILAMKYRKIDRVAFYMILPYLVWVSFATYLNALAI